mgnify:CR=1 FL=1
MATKNGNQIPFNIPITKVTISTISNGIAMISIFLYIFFRFSFSSIIDDMS